MDLFFQVIPDILFIYAEDGTILDYRAMSIKNLYTNPEAFLGKKIFEVVPEQRAPITRQNLRKAKETEEIITDHYSLEVDGLQHFFESRVRYLPDATCYVSIIRDITRQKEQEQEQLAINERIKRYAALLNTFSKSPAGIAGDIETFSREITELLGKQLPIPRVSVWLLSEENDSLTCIDCYDTASDLHQTGAFCEHNDSPLPYPGNAIRRYSLCTYTRKDPEPAPFTSVSPHSGTTVSALCCSIMLNGTPIGMLLFEAADDEKVWNNEAITFGCQTADQIGIAVLNKSRRETALALQENEKILNTYRHNLEKLVALRTLDLERAKKSAEGASAAKSSFLSNMSHEIRTPMNAILGYAHLLLQGDLTRQQRLQLQKLSSSAEHLLELINDILDLSKIDTGTLAISAYDFEPIRIIDDIYEMMSEKAAAKELDLVVNWDPDIPPVLKGDSRRLSQILLNLVGNAIKFSEKGRVSISGSLTSRTESHVQITITVQDTGIGISSEKMERLFAAFEQVDGTLSRHHGGTGLGLVISRRLAEIMGGSMQLESREGKGTKVFFTLPFEISSKPVSDAGPVHSADSTDMRKNRFSPLCRDIQKAFTRHRGAQILLVEDNLINRDVTSQLLRSVNFHVENAENGKKAVALARDHRFDLILMDIEMPEMDGYEAVRHIRQFPGWETTPIIAMTAHAYSENLGKSLQTGFNDHLVKPVEPVQLYRTIAKWLEIRDVPPQDRPVPDIDRSESSHPEADNAAAANRQGSDCRNPDRRRKQLEAIEEIDSSLGLQYMMDDVNLYISMLKQFIEKHQHDAVNMLHHAEEQDPTAVQAVAHNLKGTAATLGAVALQNSAARIEIACKKREEMNSITPLIAQAEIHLTLLISSICKYLLGEEIDAAIPAAPRIDADTAGQLLQQLEVFLEINDTSVNELFEKSRAVLLPFMGEHDSRFMRLIENYDYQEALTLIRTIRADIGTETPPHPPEPKLDKNLNIT